MPFNGFSSDGHAFLTGQLLGLMTREGWTVQPIMDGKDYTNQVVVQHPDIEGTYVVAVMTQREASKSLKKLPQPESE